MALSGSFNGSIKSGNYKLRVDWSATQNITNNTSKITATMYLVIASGWSLNISSRSDNTTAIAGTSYKWSSPSINKGGSTTKLGTVTSGNITHNADGTKSVTLTATFYVRATISGTYYEKITASATVTLNTIPRATTPTLSASSVTMGDSVTIYTARASSSFTHDLAYQFAGGAWTSIANGVGTSRTWTVPNLSASVPNSSSGLMTIRCITKNGSTTIGTKSVLLSVKVPAGTDYAPQITEVMLTEATTGLAARFGDFIQSKSKIKVAITATAAAGATIKSISTTFQDATYTGNSWTSGVISKSGTLKLVTKVTDSRGRSTTKTTNITVLPYFKPQVSEFNAYRVSGTSMATATPDEDGKYINLDYYCEVAELNYANRITTKIEYKKATETSWTTLTNYNSENVLGEVGGLNENVRAAAKLSTAGLLEFTTDAQYDLRITATDYFGASSSRIVVIPTGDVIMDIKADGTGIGIGKVAELSDVCDIAMETYLRGGLRNGCKLLWSGSHYMTGNQTATLNEAVSKQATGIVLVFSRYEVSTSTALDEDFVSHFVPKGLVEAMPKKLHAFGLNNAFYNYIGAKALSIEDTAIKGFSTNNQSSTQNGVSFNNQNWVLRYVYGV